MCFVCWICFFFFFFAFHLKKRGRHHHIFLTYNKGDAVQWAQRSKPISQITTWGCTGLAEYNLTPELERHTINFALKPLPGYTDHWKSGKQTLPCAASLPSGTPSRRLQPTPGKMPGRGWGRAAGTGCVPCREPCLLPRSLCSLFSDYPMISSPSDTWMEQRRCTFVLGAGRRFTLASEFIALVPHRYSKACLLALESGLQ